MLTIDNFGTVVNSIRMPSSRIRLVQQGHWRIVQKRPRDCEAVSGGAQRGAALIDKSADVEQFVQFPQSFWGSFARHVIEVGEEADTVASSSVRSRLPQHSAAHARKPRNLRFKI
jgi:hypothetical protein